jgi:hypothetical protein
MWGFVERLWRTEKDKKVYLRAYASVAEARASISNYLQRDATAFVTWRADAWPGLSQPAGANFRGSVTTAGIHLTAA